MFATLAIPFVLGMANFALHKAVLESGHPALDLLPRRIHAAGARLTLAFEFALLLGAMLLVANGSVFAAIAYACYAALNAISAWLVLSGRI